MKEIKCLECSPKFKAKTLDEMMKAMVLHYMNKHADMMKRENKETKEDWMQQFHKEWNKSKEI
jgi:LPS sulfotransferase NodH